MTKINCFLVDTEKSHFLKEKTNTYTIAFWDKNFSINKIELTKILKKLGVPVLRINSTKSHQKTKLRTQKRNKVVLFKPKKWFVTVEQNFEITEEIINKINTILTSPVADSKPNS
jgi:hypothetical protein